MNRFCSTGAWIGASLSFLVVSPATASTCSTNTVGQLQCQSQQVSAVGPADSALLGDYQGCQVTHDYYDVEQIWEITCQASASMQVSVVPDDCDLDVFLVDSFCDPSSDCLDRSFNTGTNTEKVQFECDAALPYYVIVERNDADYASSASDPCHSSKDFSYLIQSQCM